MATKKTIEDIAQEVITILSEEFNLKTNEVTLQSTKAEMGLDSLDDVELVMALEDKYDCDISDEEAESFVKVNDIVHWIWDNVYNGGE